MVMRERRKRKCLVVYGGKLVLEIRSLAAIKQRKGGGILVELKLITDSSRHQRNAYRRGYAGT